MSAAPLADRLRAEINEHGPIPVRRFVDAALYDPHDGFYTTGGHAGRGGDFITAPEVGPLFGAVISNLVDASWRAMGQPATFTVAEHAAGPGTLARTVTAAEGECLTAAALQWVMVEPSGPQRAQHPQGPHLRSTSSGDEVGAADLVLANELLDNLPFDIVARRPNGWVELVVAHDGARFVLRDGPAASPPAGADDLPIGTVLPQADAAAAWVAGQLARHPSADLVVLDYMAPVADLASRDGGWLRAFRDHQRVEDWLGAPGTADITIDLPIDGLSLLEPSSVTSQADVLRVHGIDELVDEGRRLWEATAHIGDLAALRARSRIVEAEALLDPQGMGGFTVMRWSRDAATDDAVA